MFLDLNFVVIHLRFCQSGALKNSLTKAPYLYNMETTEMQRVLISSSPSRVRVRMSRIRVRAQMRRTRVRVQQVSSPSRSPGFFVSSPNPSPEEKNLRALARGIFHNIMNNIIILQ